MRHRRLQSLTLLLALLLAASSWMPLPGRAEAQMRCAGASPTSKPCAHAELPASGLTDRQVYATLMSCCRSMRAGCTGTAGCPLRQPRQSTASVHRSAVSTPRCLVSLHLSTAPTTLAVRRSQWLLTAAPALAPPPLMPDAAPSAPAVGVIFWTYSPTLSPHSAPRLHGLRAPPAA